MAIREKIEKPQTDKIREEIISRGGHVLADIESGKKKKESTHFCLRINPKMLEQIDVALEDRVGISKTGWILEAIHEKLKRTIIE